MNEHSRIAILGGGLSGLVLGSELSERGVAFTMFEQNNTVGGLARTLQTGRFSWDLGVHALYSKDLDISERIRALPLDYQQSQRNVHICHAREDVVYPLDYPFENGLAGLPPDELAECVDGYREAYYNGMDSYSNLQEWIDFGLGRGFSRVFMTPYNKKIWNAELNDISMDLVSGKIEPQSYEDVLRCSRGENVEGRAYQAKFVYPRHGVQELCNYFLDRCGNNVHTNMTVQEIVKGEDGYHISIKDDQVYGPFSKIVSTIPLKILIDILPWRELQQHLSALRNNDTLFVLIGLKAGRTFDAFVDDHWTFFAGDEIFYRTTMMHNFTDEFPQACVAEYTVPNGSALSRDEVASMALEDLIRRGVVKSKHDVEIVDTHFEPFTYPIPTVGSQEVKKEIQDFLSRKNVHLLGRNGNWDYINMDQVIHRASAMAGHLAEHVI